MEIEMDLLLEITQIVSFTIVGASALASTILFFQTKNKNREKETYDYIDDKFNEYLLLCLEKPYLDVFDIEDKEKVELSVEQKKEEKIVFSYLTSIFERVYIFYVENGKKCDLDQLENWKKTIREFLNRENYRQTWIENSYGWDAGFILFMDKLYCEVEETISLESLTTKEDLFIWSEEYKNHFKLDKNNDQIEQLSYYLEENKQTEYHYYFIKHQKEIVGGMLTQVIGNAVIILYLFIKEDRRRNNYASKALRKLRTKYSEKHYFLAEVEIRNEEHKPFWSNNQFAKVDFNYFTPEVNSDNLTESEAVVVNELSIYLNQPVKTKELKKVIKTYFKTSFVQDNSVNINNFSSVRNNNSQLDEMGKVVQVRYL